MLILALLAVESFLDKVLGLAPISCAYRFSSTVRAAAYVNLLVSRKLVMAAPAIVICSAIA